MKFLKTKTAAYMVAEGLTKITIWPALKVVDKVTDKYRDTKGTLEVRYIKANLDNLTPQEKFDAAIKHYGELMWINDPIIDSTTTLLHCVRNGDSSQNQRFEIAYAYLRSSGVETFTPAIEAYYTLNINKITL